MSGDSRLADAIEQLMRAAVGITTRSLTDVGAGTDLTLQQWRALVVIVGVGAAGLRVGELAASLGLAMPGASRLAARLERRGLATVTRDAADRRVAVVRPTAAGVDLWQAVVQRRRGHIVAALEAAGSAWDAASPDLVEALAGAFSHEA